MRRATNLKTILALAGASLAFAITTGSAADSIVRTSDASAEAAIATYLPTVSLPPWIETTHWSEVVRLPQISPVVDDRVAQHALPFWAQPPLTSLAGASEGEEAFASAH